LIKTFTVERIGKAGTKFDIHKAQWFNQQYLRAKTDEELGAYLLESLAQENIPCGKEKASKIASIMKERATFPKDFWEQGKFLFFAPTVFDEGVVSKKWNDDVVKVLKAYKEELSTLDDIDAITAKTLLEKVTTSLGINLGKILQAVRVAITGAGAGPDLMKIMEILGKEEVINRIEYALDHIKLKVA
jgi:glutamyl-tRNA synthetase